MNDYTLAKLTHNEYERKFTSPVNRENTRNPYPAVLVSTIAALPFAVYAVLAFVL
ncbi:MAG: hypothetical protein AAF902_06435 [Chloroflexota bacterium]